MGSWLYMYMYIVIAIAIVDDAGNVDVDDLITDLITDLSICICHMSYVYDLNFSIAYLT